MPYIQAGQYLLAALQEVGPTMHNPMGGELPLDWAALWAYGQATDSGFEPWEYRALHRMSRTYLAAKIAGREPLAIDPVEQESDA